MNEHQIKQLLKAHGFRFDRKATHGEFWTDGTSSILVSRFSHKTQNILLKDIRDAVAKRSKPKTEVKEEPMAQEPPRKPFATIGDAVSTKPQPAPVTKKISESEAAEYARGRRNEGVAYTQIGRELFELGYKQSDGRPWSDGSIGKLVITRWPEMRCRQHREDPPAIHRQIVHVAPNLVGAVDIIRAVKQLQGLSDEQKKTVITILVEAI